MESGTAELWVNGGTASSVLSAVNQPVGGRRETWSQNITFWWCRQVFAPVLYQSVMTNPSVAVGTAHWEMGTCVTLLFWYFVYSQHTAESSCSYLGTLGVCLTSLSKQDIFFIFTRFPVCHYYFFDLKLPLLVCRFHEILLWCCHIIKEHNIPCQRTSQLCASVVSEKLSRSPVKLQILQEKFIIPGDFEDISVQKNEFRIL